jgi:hypothetical protein
MFLTMSELGYLRRGELVANIIDVNIICSLERSVNVEGGGGFLEALD